MFVRSIRSIANTPGETCCPPARQRLLLPVRNIDPRQWYMVAGAGRTMARFLYPANPYRSGWILAQSVFFKSSALST